MSGETIINANDFCLCEDVNKAVVKAHTEGILVVAAIMTGAPDSDGVVKSVHYGRL